MGFEREWTVMLPTGTGPDVRSVETRLPDPAGSRYKLTAWASGVGPFPALVMEGRISLAEAQQRITGSPVDALMSVPSGGDCEVEFDGDNWLTVFFPVANASGQSQFVTLRLHALSSGQRRPNRR